MNAILRKRSVRFGMFIMGVIAMVGTLIALREIGHRYDKRMTASCGNHVIQLRFLVMTFVEENAQFPAETDARMALMKMRQPGEHPDSWFASLGSACPESFRRDQSIGYVFVADGLPTRVAVETSALVLFCPADSHQRSQQHCHAVMGGGDLDCIMSNAEMIGLLRREIGRAKQGTVPYSSNAVSKMEWELKRREEYARKREPNNSMQRTGASRPARAVIVAQRRLAPAADAGRSATQS